MDLSCGSICAAAARAIFDGDGRREGSEEEGGQCELV